MFERERACHVSMLPAAVALVNTEHRAPTDRRYVRFGSVNGKRVAKNDVELSSTVLCKWIRVRSCFVFLWLFGWCRWCHRFLSNRQVFVQRNI